jgi:prepilin-type N-terminal cleavage/methylation domain-containing protein
VIREPNQKRLAGFTLIELMTALAIFLLICGAAFSLLGMSQKRYQTESQVLNSLQEARLGLDQIVRDVNDSGFPPANQFSFTVPPSGALFTRLASSPFAWSPGSYPNSPCAIGMGCTTPGDFDLIIETDINPQANDGVEWVRYQLQGQTLYRGFASKSGAPPATATSAAGVLAPFVQNVVNNASAAQIAQFQTYYPGMFPGGLPVPIFAYTCDTATTPLPCPSAGSYNSPQDIRDVGITLIVTTPMPDAQTGQPRLVALKGRGRRINPNQ